MEADRRKATFLREAARVTGAAVSVRQARIEDTEVFPADVITARACAPLEKLLALAKPYTHAETTCLFLKGKSVNQELTQANKVWNIKKVIRPSRTDPDGSILLVQEYLRVPDNGAAR